MPTKTRSGAGKQSWTPEDARELIAIRTRLATFSQSATASTRLNLPVPHAGQARVLAEAKRWNVVACGRRWGKTKLGQDRLIAAAMAGNPAAWFSPTYKMLGEVWREVRNILQPVTRSISVQEHRIELTTGGVIDMWSLDTADSVRGRKYARVILDEAAMVANLTEAWNAVVRPTLTDYRGDAWFLSTPKGQNFFWQLYLRAGDDPDYAAWQMPTVENPIIDPEEVEEARRQLPERTFQQEYLAEFIEESGGVFRKVREAIDAGRSANELPIARETYVLGVDLARVEDFSVLSVFDSRKRQVYHERFNQISWERQVAAIVRAAQLYNNASVLIDSTGVGDPIFEALLKAGLRVQGYHFTNQSKTALIDALALALENAEVRLMDLPAQTNELMAYQYELTPSRLVRMNAPEGMHDDCVISLALAHWQLKNRRLMQVS